MVLSMDRWIGKVAIVTGASSGIGESVAEMLVEIGMQVVGVARRLDKLIVIQQRTSEKKGKFHPLQGDISKEQNIMKVFQWTEENLGPVHVLVNNAGVVCKSKILDGKTEDWLHTINVNVVGLCMATREALRLMIENGIDGHIININSTAGHIVPTMSKHEIYTATKHAVTALTESMRRKMPELQQNIKFTSISPGLVASEMANPAKLLKSLPPGTTDPSSIPILEPRDIADAVEYVLSTPSHVQVHELMIRPTGEML